MKFVSWNVNGLRACVNKGFMDSFYQLDADFFCLQETKLQEGQIQLELPGYHQYWCCAQKKGYSGTAIFTKHKPLSVAYGLGIEELDTEGRLITLEYQEFYLVTCYTPNAQRGLARIDHRMEWEKALREYLMQLDVKKPVVYCGDLNVAHQEIDLKNPASNRGNAGFSDQERDAFSRLLGSGFTDSFRHLYPDATGAYSWWSYMFNARQNNAGWRIDYFVVSDRLAGAISDATIHPDIMGSDHCPVGLDLSTTCNGSIWSPDTKAPQKATNADRETSAGAFGFMIKCGIGLTAALLLMICGTWVLHRYPTSRPQQPETHNMVPAKLITDLRYLGSDVEITEDSSPCFRYGNEIWRPVEPLVNLDSYPREPTFYAVVTFSEDEHFTPEHLPQLHYRKSFENDFGYMYFYAPYLTHQFFYGADGTVAGFLLMADVPEDITVSVMVQDISRVSTIELTITAQNDETDYSSMTTSELVRLVCSDPLLTQLQPYWYDAEGLHYKTFDYSLGYFVTHNAAAAELVGREDAVDVMIDFLADPQIFSVDLYSNIVTLLEYEALHAQMSAEQLEIYLKNKPEDTGLREYFSNEDRIHIIISEPVAQPQG